MEIGLHLPSAQAGANAASILETARSARSRGFDAVWMFDHLLTPVDLGSRYPYSPDGSYPLGPDAPFFDPLALFGVLAGATDEIKIGTGVLIGAYRHPIVLAKMLASIERFAPGRLILGIGTGWMREEFDAVDVPFERRGARLTEYLAALRALWSGDTAAFEGEFYSWPAAGFLPAPTAPIPLIVGGHSDPALRRAARHGDGWAISTSKGQGSGLEGVGARIEVLRGFLDEHDRDSSGFHLLYQTPLWFSERPNRRFPLSGTPDDIGASLVRLRELGVTMVDLLVFGPSGAIDEAAARFCEEVRRPD